MSRRWILSLTAALLSCGLAWSDPPKLAIPPEVKPAGQYVQFLPETDAASVLYVGLSGLDPIPAAVLKDGRLFLLDVRGLPKGRYQFAAVGSSKGGEQARADFAVVIGDAPPAPTPTPPGPTPTPTPTPPTPPTPVLADGLFCLIVTETSDLTRLPPAQVSILTSQIVWDYLRAKCPKGGDGKTPEFRIWDQHVDTSKAEPAWQAAMKRPRASLPWLLLSNPRTGAVYYDGPLPGSIDEMMSLLKKFGG